MIVVRTSVVEAGLYRSDYDAFIALLMAEGYPARLDEPDESRSLSHDAIVLGIWVANAVAGDAVVGAIKRAASATIGRARRARKHQPTRRLPIYGPNGDVLSWVDLPAESDDVA